MGGKSIAGAALGIALGVAAVCTGGWALPYPYSAIGPTVPHLLRSELVEEIAARQRPRCLVVAGNSRLAFGVNAAGLSSPQCPAANIGFPGLGAYEVYELIDQERQVGMIASLALVVGDDYLIQHGLLPTRRDAPMDPTLFVTNPREGFVKVDFVRQAWIQVYRFQTFLEAAYGKDLTTNVFRWDQRLRRWIWPAMQDQQLDKLDGRDRLLDAVAAEYYGRGEGSPDELTEFVAKMRALADSLTIVFPPQHPAFAESVNRLRPGLQRMLIERLANVARKAGVRFIDCSVGATCGVSDDMFADPVHTNARGAAAFTAFLKAKLGQN